MPLLNDYAGAISHLMYKDGLHIPLEVVGLGLAGEAAELTSASSKWLDAVRELGRQNAETDKLRDHAILEAGDVLWYIAALASCRSTMLGAYDVEDAPVTTIQHATGVACDRIKKEIWHGKPPTTFVYQLDICRLIGTLRSYCQHFFGLSLEEVGDRNVAKLKKRYPDGFVEGGGLRMAA